MKENYQNFILYILHNIYLTKEQRYALANKEPQKVIGVSLPVWYDKKTSEPAKEIFCQYKLENKPGRHLIRSKNNQYVINLPQLEKDYVGLDPIDYDLLNQMTTEQRSAYLEHRDNMALTLDKIVSGKNLLNPADGGSAYLRFEVTNRGNLAVEPDTIVTINHLVVINTVESLEESLIM